MAPRASDNEAPRGGLSPVSGSRAGTQSTCAGRARRDLRRPALGRGGRGQALRARGREDEREREQERALDLHCSLSCSLPNDLFCKVERTLSLFTSTRVHGRSRCRDTREPRDRVLLTAWTPRWRGQTAWLEWRGGERAEERVEVELWREPRRGELLGFPSCSPSFFFFLAGTFPPPSFFSPPLLSLEPALFFLKRRRKVKRGATCSLCFFFPPSLSFRQGRCRAETLPSSLFAASLAELDKRERAERKNKNSSFRRSSNDAPTTNNGRRRPRLLLPSAAPVVASVQALSSLPTRQREALFPLDSRAQDNCPSESCAAVCSGR